MKSTLLPCLPIVLSFLVIGNAAQPSTQQSSQSEKIAHGKYLVHDVAQCIQCHTPRDADGDLIGSRLLSGAPILVQGPKSAKPWAAASASIAGLVNYDRDFVKYLLMHGKNADGSTPTSPMPRFHLSESDADAVVAYLQSRRR